MRLLALTLAVVTGLAMGCSKVDNTPAKVNEAADVAVTPASSKMVIKVPTMSCPHGCWPTVKKTLEGQEGVASVELAKQSEEETIDTPEVTIFYNGNFDAPKAIDALSKSGFDGAEVLN
jgi:copper chaperone CopZ